MSSVTSNYTPPAQLIELADQLQIKDIATTLAKILVVQSTRADILADLLKSTLNVIKTRNERLAVLNEMQGYLQSMAGLLKADAGPDTALANLSTKPIYEKVIPIDTWFAANITERTWNNQKTDLSWRFQYGSDHDNEASDQRVQYDAYVKACKETPIAPPPLETYKTLMDKVKALSETSGIEVSHATKQLLDTSIKSLEVAISTLNNENQMDMLVMQKFKDAVMAALEEMTSALAKGNKSEQGIAGNFSG